MGKKGKHKVSRQSQSKVTGNGNGNGASKARLPFVSVCTPTFNRRPFIQAMVNNFLRQDYPRDRMEWIIIDDGTDKIEDLVKDVPCVKYFHYPKKMFLGKKRNLMHEKTTGEILVYMDDDDYYPPCRVSHAVDTLQKNPEALCVGSSEIYIWFNELNRMVQFGPYGPKHATAGTFAFRRKLLREHKYDDSAALAEERSFLKAYTVPFAQLDPLKTILVFSHEHNTYDKRKLLENPHPDYVRTSDKTVDMFVKEADAKEFYTHGIMEVLRDYEPGRPEMKPDVLEQTKKIEEFRRAELERMGAEMAKRNGDDQGTVVYTAPDGSRKELTNPEIVQTLSAQHRRIYELEERLGELERQIDAKDSECGRLKTLNALMIQKMKNGNTGGRTGGNTGGNMDNAGCLLVEGMGCRGDCHIPTEADAIIGELFA